MPQNCIYSSVTLQTGEQYVLPPGAVIVSATDPTKITSANNCADLTQLETPQCYGFFVQESRSDGGDAAYNDVEAQGITIGGVYYQFNTPVSVPPVADNVPTTFIVNFQAQLNLLPIGDLFSNFSGWNDLHPNTGDAAYTTMLCFKTIPSVANGALIKFIGFADEASPTIPFYVPILEASDMLTNYLTTDPDFAANCGCNS